MGHEGMAIRSSSPHNETALSCGRTQTRSDLDAQHDRCLGRSQQGSDA